MRFAKLQYFTSFISGRYIYRQWSVLYHRCFVVDLVKLMFSHGYFNVYVLLLEDRFYAIDVLLSVFDRLAAMVQRLWLDLHMRSFKTRSGVQYEVNPHMVYLRWFAPILIGARATSFRNRYSMTITKFFRFTPLVLISYAYKNSCVYWLRIAKIITGVKLGRRQTVRIISGLMVGLFLPSCYVIL